MKKSVTAIACLALCILSSISIWASDIQEKEETQQFKPTGTIYAEYSGNQQTRAGYVPCTITLSGKRTNSVTVRLTTAFQPSIGLPMMDDAILWVTYRDGSGPPCNTHPKSTGKFAAYISVHEGFAVPETATNAYGNGKYYMSNNTADLTCQIK